MDKFYNEKLNKLKEAQIKRPVAKIKLDGEQSYHDRTDL